MDEVEIEKRKTAFKKVAAEIDNSFENYFNQQPTPFNSIVGYCYLDGKTLDLIFDINTPENLKQFTEDLYQEYINS